MISGLGIRLYVPVPVVQTVDILVFLHSPGKRHVSHPNLLTLVYERRARLQRQSRSQHLG